VLLCYSMGIHTDTYMLAYFMKMETTTKQEKMLLMLTNNTITNINPVRLLDQRRHWNHSSHNS
jgi:hypothetical protein